MTKKKKAEKKPTTKKGKKSGSPDSNPPSKNKVKAKVSRNKVNVARRSNNERSVYSIAERTATHEEPSERTRNTNTTTTTTLTNSLPAPAPTPQPITPMNQAPVQQNPPVQMNAPLPTAPSPVVQKPASLQQQQPQQQGQKIIRNASMENTECVRTMKTTPIAQPVPNMQLPAVTPCVTVPKPPQPVQTTPAPLAPSPVTPATPNFQNFHQGAYAGYQIPLQQQNLPNLQHGAFVPAPPVHHAPAVPPVQPVAHPPVLPHAPSVPNVAAQPPHVPQPQQAVQQIQQPMRPQQFNATPPPPLQPQPAIPKAPVQMGFNQNPNPYLIHQKKAIIGSNEREEGTLNDQKQRTGEIVTCWMNRTISMGLEGMKKEYKDAPNDAPPERSIGFRDNPQKNRYYNVPCADASRFRIENDPSFYCHANFVSSGPIRKRYLCAQAPLPTTVEDFWKMTVHAGIEFIVMLCNLVEKGKPKSAEYFPQKLGDVLTVGGFCTVAKEQMYELEKGLIMSTFRVQRLDDESVMLIKHIHWQSWPDHGVPESLITPIKVILAIRDSRTPILVHCSAGVGRTGTLVLIAIILENLRYPDFPGIPILLSRLREERFKAIQTEIQYLYVYRTVLEYLRVKKYQIVNMALYNKFKDEYDYAFAKCPD